MRFLALLLASFLLAATPASAKVPDIIVGVSKPSGDVMAMCVCLPNCEEKDYATAEDTEALQRDFSEESYNICVNGARASGECQQAGACIGMKWVVRQRYKCECETLGASGACTYESKNVLYDWGYGKVDSAAFCKLDCDELPGRTEACSGVRATAEGFLSNKCPDGAEAGTSCLRNPIGVTTVAGLVGNILKAMLGVLGSLALLMFIYGGFLWLTSGGSADKIGKGKDVMKWAAIGLFLVFAAAAAVRFALGAFTTL